MTFEQYIDCDHCMYCNVCDGDCTIKIKRSLTMEEKKFFELTNTKTGKKIVLDKIKDNVYSCGKENVIEVHYADFNEKDNMEIACLKCKESIFIVCGSLFDGSHSIENISFDGKQYLVTVKNIH